MLEILPESYAKVFEAGGFIAMCIFFLSLLLYSTIIDAYWVGSRSAKPYKFIKNGGIPLDYLSSANSYWGGISQKLIDYGSDSKSTSKFLRNSKERLRRNLNTKIQRIRLGASAATLLGLLGTITGMIETFSAISSNTSSETAHMVANGISKALVTTNAGLVVAIPAVALSYWIDKKLKQSFKVFETIQLEQTSHSKGL